MKHGQETQYLAQVSLELADFDDISVQWHCLRVNRLLVKTTKMQEHASNFFLCCDAKNMKITVLFLLWIKTTTMNLAQNHLGQTWGVLISRNAISIGCAYQNVCKINMYVK